MDRQLIVLQPTPFCNIDCRYCYLGHRSSTRRMSPQVLSRIAEALFESSYVDGGIEVLWHAGEPLSVPIAFYEEAAEVFDRFNAGRVVVSYVVQTNATLVSQEWCDFFTAHSVQVGVSVDGPRELHDANRVDRAGRGTFDRVMRGIDLLRRNGIPLSIIMVLTDGSLDRVEAIWEFLMENDVASVGFNLEEVTGVNASSSVYSEAALGKWRSFLERIVELREESESLIAVREIDEREQRIKHGGQAIMSALNTPFQIISFDCEGNVSTFCPELLTSRHEIQGDFLFGNVMRESLESAFTSAKFMRANAAIQRGKARCAAACDYFSVCGGGHPSNKLWENGTFDSTETMHCRQNLQITCDVVLARLEHDLRLV